MTTSVAHSIIGHDRDGGRPDDDFYPTPPEAVHALLDVEDFPEDIWEPACGDGAISKVLEGKGHGVYSSDLNCHGYGYSGVDFLLSTRSYCVELPIITNPPFKLAREFATHALYICSPKVALLCRLAFLEGKKRKIFFENTPLKRVWVFSWRVSMWRGGIVTGKGRMMPYAWFVWEKGYRGPPTLGWL